MSLLQLREVLFAALVIPGAARWRHTPQLTYKQPERVELVVVAVVCGQHGLGPVCSSVTILTPPHHHLAPPQHSTTTTTTTTTTSVTPPQHSTAQHRTCSIPAGCLHSKKVFAPLCKPVVLGNGHVSKMLVRMKQEQMYTTDAIDCLIT